MTKKKVLYKTYGRPDNRWWLSGGIDYDNVAAVWQPLYAESLSESYKRIAGDEGNANVDPAVTGVGVAPSFNAKYGWRGDGATVFLDTGIIPGGAIWSAIALLSSANVSVNGSPFGLSEVSIAPLETDLFYWSVSVGVAHGFGLYNRSVIHSDATLMNGTGGFAGYSAFLNGSSVSTMTAGIAPWANFGESVYLLAVNGSPDFSYMAGDLMAVAFYKTVITDAQMLAVHAALAAL